MATVKTKVKKVQSKFPMKLVEHIEKQKGFISMNSFLKEAAVEKSNFKQ